MFKLNSKKKKKIPLQTKKIEFSYSKENILKGIDLEIKKSSITAIIGKSGCGKTTFLKLIAGVLSKKHKGKIKIFGKNKFFRKGRIGFIPQEISFIPDISIKDNLKIAGLNLGIKEKIALNRGKNLMEALKLNEDFEKNAQNLSGGQKTRLNIVLSLLNDPEIIIFDEPFVGLDFRNRKLLWHFIENLKRKGKIILLTSHLLSEVEENVDKIILLKKGKIFFNGKAENLKKRLKIEYIFELKIGRLSKTKKEKLKDYLKTNQIFVLDSYSNYLMLGLKDLNFKEKLTKFLKKMQIPNQEIKLREPNLDELFLKEE